jgi:NAD(P)H-dependent FMN reductase
LRWVFVFAAIQLSKESVNGMEIEYIDISPLPMLNTDLEVNGTFPPVVEAFRQKILQADSVLFASPEYNFSVTGMVSLSLLRFVYSFIEKSKWA